MKNDRSIINVNYVWVNFSNSHFHKKNYILKYQTTILMPHHTGMFPFATEDNVKCVPTFSPSATREKTLSSMDTWCISHNDSTLSLGHLQSSCFCFKTLDDIDLTLFSRVSYFLVSSRHWPNFH